MTFDVLRSVAGYGLSGSRTPAVHDPLGSPSWRSLTALVKRHGLNGFLFEAVRGGDIAVTERQYETIEEAHLRDCVTAVVLERRMLGVVDALGRAGIPALVLKGPAVAHLDYPRPDLRLYTDIDLLLPSDGFEAGLEVLRGIGYRRKWLPPASDFDRRFGKGATLRDAEGFEMDVHRTLAFGAYGVAIDLDDLFTSATTFEVGGRDVPALGAEARLLHACYHAAIGSPAPRLASLRDIAQMLLANDREPDVTVEMARRWRGELVVRRAVGLVRNDLGLNLDGPIATAFDDHRPGRAERRALASYVGTNRGFAASVLATLPYLDGTGDRIAFLRAAVRPSGAFLADRGQGPLTWLARGLRSLIGIRRIS